MYHVFFFFSLFCTGDNTPPTIANCPTNIDRTVELGSSGLPVSWLEPTATDLSGVVTLSVRSNAPGSTFNLGTTIVNYIFIDSSSNEAMCTFSVTVVPGKRIKMPCDLLIVFIYMYDSPIALSIGDGLKPAGPSYYTN